MKDSTEEKKTNAATPIKAIRGRCLASIGYEKKAVRECDLPIALFIPLAKAVERLVGSGKLKIKGLIAQEWIERDSVEL